MKARTVSSYTSATEAGASATIGWSPCVPQRACITSPCAGLVGSPVLGPARITSTTTHGISVEAAYPTCSCMSEKPGPLVAVIALRPASEAPSTAPSDAISSSICTATPPRGGNSSAIRSAISDEGVIG